MRLCALLFRPLWALQLGCACLLPHCFSCVRHYCVPYCVIPTYAHPTAAGRFGLYGWLRMLVVSYFSNLVGALLLVGLMVSETLNPKSPLAAPTLAT